MRPISVATEGLISNSLRPLSVASEGLLLSASVIIPEIPKPNFVYSTNHEFNRKNKLEKQIRIEDDEVMTIIRLIAEKIL